MKRCRFYNQGLFEIDCEKSMGYPFGTTCALPLLLGCLLAGAAAHAAPLTINGATFNAPSSCQLAEGALMCKLDGQQLEIWVVRKALAPAVQPVDSFARRAAHFDALHNDALANIKRTTGNVESRPFSNYGRYSAAGADMPGKGAVATPAIRFASVLHGDEIWEFLEVVATRTPALEALSAELQRSLVLPAAASTASRAPSGGASAAVEPPKKDAARSVLASIDGKLLSLQYPRFLEATDVVDTAGSFSAVLKHNTRTSGPRVVISLRAAAANPSAADIVANRRKDALAGAKVAPDGLITITRLGSVSGVGFVLISTPATKDGKPGIETIETMFAANVSGRLLEVRLNAEQKHAAELEEIWSALASSIAISK